MKFDGFINIAVTNSRKNTNYNNQEVLWSDFVRKLKSTVYTKETMAEYEAMEKTTQDDIKDVGGFVGGSLKDNKRRKGNVISKSILTLDADYAYEGMEGIVDLLYGFAACIYSTHKHRKNKPRLRFVIPLSRRVSSDEYEAIARMVASDMGIDYFDDTTYEPERLMYYPSTSKDGEFVYKVTDGKWLDVDEILCRYKDFRDASSWPVSRRCREKFVNIKEKQQNPREKEGMIGAFCRVYDIHSAIENFLSDIYVKCEEGDRYTYTKGSSACGLVIYENGDFAYSHHSTDPCSSRLCNSFDLVGIHLFKDSMEDMLEFCSQDKKVVGEFGRFKLKQAQTDFEIIENNNTEFNSEANTEIDNELYDDSWIENLEVDKKGYYKPSVKNIVTILENDINLKNTIKFDEFSETIMKYNKNNKKYKETYTVWDDYNDSNLRYYLEKNYGIYAPIKTDDAISTVAKNKSFHPIRDYINSLTWDNTNRIDTLLTDYLGAEDSEYTRAVIRKAMVAAVARVYEPGIKFDYMPVLVGPQGVGKSHILSLIGKNWYSDSFNTVIGKEAYEQLQGCWIIEMAELSAIRKAEAEAVKHFISKREDVYRAAYGRRVTKHKRQCIFFGTTNDIEFLKDKTGNRRYWPVVVAYQKPTKNMFKELNKKEIDQLWAEAKYFYDNKEPLIMEEKLSHETIKKQEQHMEANIKEGMITEYLELLLPDEWKAMDISARRRFVSGSDFADIKGSQKRERVCAMEIWCELFGGDARNMNPMQSREINDILRKIKGWKVYPRNSGKARFGIYGLQKAFVREEN